jgi:hypothetical protein
LEEGCFCVDVGFGTGVLLKGLHARYPHSTWGGVDHWPEDIGQLRVYLGSDQLYQCGVQERPFDVGAVDVAISTKIYHGVMRTREQIKAMADHIFLMIVKGGYYIPAFEGLFIGAFDGIDSEEELFGIFESVGFVVERRNGALGVLRKPELILSL